MSVALALGGCGAVQPAQTNTSADAENTTHDASTGSVTTTDTGGRADTTMLPGTSALGTTLDPSTDSGGFVPEHDGGQGGFVCDLFTQDCPEGQKCMPWADDGGGAWNATRCSPIADNPGEPGDPCMVEGSDTSGVDDCELGSVCWDVDPKTNTGTCVGMCTGTRGNPVCEDPDTQCSIDGGSAVMWCLPVCDPLQQDCPQDQACYPVSSSWVCAPDASGDMGAHGDPCEFINVCNPGLICFGVAATPDCTGSAGCCAEVCDITDPAGDAQCTGAPDGQTCQSWYESRDEVPLPGYEDVGVCALPM
ncbi:MAG: ribulose phosphate epimerase [Deltaproteobacteria bacterium]|nr:ribulose phosphate epimerase [Deltaproteobacteria bacterium]